MVPHEQHIIRGQNILIVKNKFNQFVIYIVI